MERKYRITVSLDVVLQDDTPENRYQVRAAAEAEATNAVAELIHVVESVELFNAEIECDCGAVMSEDFNTGTAICPECNPPEGRK
jgi:hypothetical protein